MLCSKASRPLSVRKLTSYLQSRRRRLHGQHVAPASIGTGAGRGHSFVPDDFFYNLVSSHELSALNSTANFEVSRHGASHRRD